MVRRTDEKLFRTPAALGEFFPGEELPVVSEKETGFGAAGFGMNTFKLIN